MATRSNSIASSAEEHSSAHFFDGGENEVGRDVWGLEPISLRSVEKDTSDPYRPDIDIIHVEAAASGEERLLTDDFLLTGNALKTARRQWRFRTDISCLLKEEYTHTLIAIDVEARRLLKGLKDLQAEDSKSRKAIIFVAYDLGSLVVKKALAMARCEDEWASIFTSAARLVFCGCFQRGTDALLLERAMFGFLLAVSEDKWTMLLTFSAVRNLVMAVEELNETFLASKITLRSRMFSLFASEPEGRWVKKYFTKHLATLGIATELMIEEKAENKDNAFPSLASNMSTAVKDWIAEPPKAAMEITLMSLVPPDCRMASQSQPSQSDQLHATTDYDAWLSGKGVRVLHIHSPNAIGTANVAEQIGHQFVLRRQAARSYWARPFAFDFTLAHPTHRPMQDMMIAGILHFFAFACNPGSTSYSDRCAMLQDQFGLYNAWLEDDARNMFELFTSQFSDNYLFLLHGLDHCPQESRAVLWSILSGMAERSEECFRFVVTSGDANLSSSEICNSGIHYDECRLRLDDLYPGLEPLDDEANMESMVLRLSPGGQGRAQIRQILSNTQHMQRSVLKNYISFVQRRTCWPKTASKSNLLQFCSLLEDLNTHRIPGPILSELLEAVEDQKQTELILAWILHGYRPLSPLELVEILLHTCRSRSPCHTEYSPELTSLEILQHIRSTLGSFVDFSNCQVRIHSDFAELLDEEEDYIWSRAKAAAPQLTLDFLLTYLKSSDSQERLRVLYHQYTAKVRVAGENITPPMEKTGEDVLLYAVQALPHHLSMAEVHPDTELLLKNPLGPYSAWARLYWAMSNPFSRPRGGPCLSAWATWRMVSSGPANMIYIRDTINDHDGKTEGEESDRDSAEIAIMAELHNAVRANNKDMAVNLARQLVEKHQSVSQSLVQSIQWPPSILWRATWLNMVELVDLLLNNGVQPDDSSAAYTPSPLYLAAILGFGRLVEVLLGHGANVTVKKMPGMRSPVTSAAAYGHTHVVEALIRHTPSLIEEASPTTPLYRACYWGAFKVAEALLKMKADVDQPGTTLESAIAMDENSSNPPLVAACDRGHVNTIRLLLAHGAKVNAPARLDTAISWAAIDACSIDCVRLLLQYGADPNHELLSPPLLTQIMQTSMPDNEKVAMFEVLVNNIPPVLVDKPDVDEYGGRTPLMEAALQGELIAVRWLLEHGADTAAVDNGNRHALFHAVHSKKRAVVEEILKHQALENRNIVASDGSTVLEASMDDVPLFKLLLEANLDPEIENGEGQTALNFAAEKEKVEVVKLLLERNVDVHHRDKVGWSPILDATGCRPNPEIARMLLEHGADPKDSTRAKSTALHQATRESRPDVLRVLLEFRECLDLNARNEDDETALSLAYESTTTEEEKECIKLLIRTGADVNYARDEGGETLLMVAAKTVTPDQNLDDCLLAAPQINVNAISSRFGSALTVACRNANFSLASKLLDRGADVNFYAPILESTPLIAACLPWWDLSQRGVDIDDYFSRSEQLIRELISRGADVNLERGCNVYNALSAAALMGSINAINYLLDKGASVGKRDPLGRQAIHFSAASGLRNFEGLCLAAGDDIRTPDNFGKNVLHWAAQFGHVRTVQSIVRRLSFLPARDRRDFINSRDIDGWTPLAWASRPVVADLWLGCSWSFSEEQNYAATIQFLIEEGADPTVEFQVHPHRSDEMITAWKMAKRCQLELPKEIFCMLKSKTDIANTTDSTDNDQGNAERSEESLKYVQRRVDCDICFSTVYGVVYECNTCFDFDVCGKCYTRIEEYHKPLMNFRGGNGGPTHEFRVGNGYNDEFERPSSTPSPVESIVGSKPRDTGSPTENEAVDADENDHDQTGQGAYADASIDGLHLSDLSDLEDDEEGMLDDMDI